MRIFDIVVILIVVGMSAVGIGTFLTSVDNAYNLNLSDTSLQSLNLINDTDLLNIDIGSAIDKPGLQADAESEASFVQAGIRAAKLTLRLPEFFAALAIDLFNSISQATGLHPIFVAGPLALVGLVVAFGLAAAVLKRLI